MKKKFKFLIGGLVLFGIIGACSDDKAVENKEQAKVEETQVEEAVEAEPIKAEPVVTEPVKEEPVDTELISYSTDIQNYMGDLTNVMYDFSSLMLEAGDNPTLMFDESWTIDVATQLVLMQEGINNVKSLNPPNGFEEVHNLILKAMDEYQFVVNNLPVSIDNMDVNLMNQCSEAITNGSSYIQEATNLLSEKI